MKLNKLGELSIGDITSLDNEPEFNLILAIFAQATHDKDYKFFKSSTFRYYCDIIGLEPTAVRRNLRIKDADL